MSESESEPADDEAGADEAQEQETAVAKLFGEWEVTNVDYQDPSTERYITVTPIAHTMGRHANKQFQKSEIPSSSDSSTA